MEQIFKRKAYDQMLEWKAEQGGATALLIQGARRVGKSTLAEHFAQNEYESYILVDFANVDKEVSSLFDDLTDMDHIFNTLQVRYHVELVPRKSVVIFDEVQKCPNARQAIKYLVKDGRYDYIETGSLISIRKNVKDIVIPSEEVTLELHPMDYEEFRWALGDSVTLRLLRGVFAACKSLGDATNRKLMRDFRLYMLVGGMPQAVATYLATKSLSKVDVVKRNIISLYDSDFMKIDPTGVASRLFRAIPSEVGRNSSRYQVTSATENGRASRIPATIAEMADSMVVNMAYHADDPSVGMALHMSSEKYKMYLCDTGLFVTLAFWDKHFTENTIYEKLLSDKLSADLGYVYENVVAQMLRASGNRLYYYTFPTDSSKHIYEIDFLLSEGTKVCPIEVKSSGYKAHASLDAFCEKYPSRVGNRYLIYTKDLRKDGNVLYMPAYMTLFL